jgi:hypothetical protein
MGDAPGLGARLKSRSRAANVYQKINSHNRQLINGFFGYFALDLVQV